MISPRLSNKENRPINQYKTLKKNKLSKLTETAENHYFNKFVDVQYDIKHTWQLINNIINNQTAKPIVKELNVNNIDEKTDMKWLTNLLII